MASFTVTVPDAQVDRVAAALGWPEVAIGAETKAQCVKRQIMLLIKTHVTAYETDKLRAATITAIPAAPTLDIT